MSHPILSVSLVLAAAAVLFASSPASAAEGAASPAAEKQGRTLYHVVSFKFKETATKEQIRAVEEAFGALKEKIPGIKTLEWGTNVSPEKHAKGYTHCFVLTFATEKDRDGYLVAPAHKEFGKLVGPVIADVFVIDFWSASAK